MNILVDYRLVSGSLCRNDEWGVFQVLISLYLSILFYLPTTIHIEPSTLFHEMTYATIDAFLRDI